MEAGLARVGILDCFACLVTTDEVGASKQDAVIYERALAVLGSPRERTWAVDDAPYAIAVMAAFGLRTVGVAGGCGPDRREKLLQSADVVVETLMDVSLP